MAHVMAHRKNVFLLGSDRFTAFSKKKKKKREVYIRRAAFIYNYQRGPRTLLEGRLVFMWRLVLEDLR